MITDDLPQFRRLVVLYNLNAAQKAHKRTSHLRKRLEHLTALCAVEGV